MNAPYVMHLESVVRNIEKGWTFTIELCSKEALIRNVTLRICENGDVAYILRDGDLWHYSGLTLANYKLKWRCWKGGKPTNAERKALKWR